MIYPSFPFAARPSDTWRRGRSEDAPIRYYVPRLTTELRVLMGLIVGGVTACLIFEHTLVNLCSGSKIGLKVVLFHTHPPKFSSPCTLVEKIDLYLHGLINYNPKRYHIS